MFNLFGKKSQPTTTVTKPTATTNSTDTIQRLKKQIETLEKREAHQTAKMNALAKEAVEKGKKKR
jgi:hypothetical protein